MTLDEALDIADNAIPKNPQSRALKVLSRALHRITTEVAIDAARYRWVREHGAWETKSFLKGLSATEYDEVVDRRIREQY